MTYKKLIKKLVVLPILLNTLVVQALEIPAPYIVAASIPSVPIEKDACIVLLREKPMEGHDEFIKQSIEEIELEIVRVTNDFQAINDEIVFLETESPDSLANSQETLGQILEEVYLELANGDPEFMNLTEADQGEIISQNEYVQSWLVYIEELQQLILGKVAKRDQLESYYLNLQYDLDNLKDQQIQQEYSQAEYNQCLLYPYSSKRQSMDEILLNNQLSLNDFLIQVDSYLSQIVAKAYANVKFEDIYQRFINELTAEELQASYMTKAPIELTEDTLSQYSYAKELNLKDIQTIVEFAQYKYQQDQNMEDYLAIYQEVIVLKENQWQYLYHINEEVFENLKTQLATYLNHQEATSERDIELVRGLQQRYQIKLVLFNEGDKTWYTNSGSQSGFLEEYRQKEIMIYQDNEDKTQEETSEETSLDNRHTSISTQEAEEIPESLKDKFLSNMEKRGQRQLPLPQTEETKDKSKAPTMVKDKEKERESGQVKLPSTGEQRPVTIIAVILLILGIALLITNRLTRKKRQDKLDEIELD